MLVRAFQCMNTTFHIWLDAQERGARQALDEAERFAHDVEATLSRFRADSALSRINHAPGRWHLAPPILVEVLTQALEWAKRTNGVFDPTVLYALHVAGYDRTFEHVGDEKSKKPSPVPFPVRLSGAWREIRVKDEAVYIPEGVGIDLGGIAKEWTVDQMADLLSNWGPCLVDAGGDIRAIGAPMLWGTWPVGIAHPLREDKDVSKFGLSDGAIATSSRARRRWTMDGREAHHLIDPITGRPAQSSLLSATVIAPTTVMAGVLSKVAMIREEAARTLLVDSPECGAILIRSDGYVDATLFPMLEVIHA